MAIYSLSEAHQVIRHLQSAWLCSYANHDVGGCLGVVMAYSWTGYTRLKRISEQMQHRKSNSSMNQCGGGMPTSSAMEQAWLKVATAAATTTDKKERNTMYESMLPTARGGAVRGGVHGPRSQSFDPVDRSTPCSKRFPPTTRIHLGTSATHQQQLVRVRQTPPHTTHSRFVIQKHLRSKYGHDKLFACVCTEILYTKHKCIPQKFIKHYRQRGVLIFQDRKSDS